MRASGGDPAGCTCGLGSTQWGHAVIWSNQRNMSKQSWPRVTMDVGGSAAKAKYRREWREQPLGECSERVVGADEGQEDSRLHQEGRREQVMYINSNITEMKAPR